MHKATPASRSPMETTLRRDKAHEVIWDLLRSGLPHPLTDSVDHTSGFPEFLRQRTDDCRHFLDELYFRNLHYRERDIDKAHAKTFEWIFRQPPLTKTGAPLWSSFSDWLEGDSEDIYWITGKPGAGKSTLLKFFLNDPRTQELLQKWAVDSPLLVLDYYSWNAGTELQKSAEGLLRTMLFQALQTRLHLIPKVLFARWTMLGLFGANYRLPRLEIEELLDAFRRLIVEVTKEGKLVLVIDGLDEFESDHQQLVDLIRDISNHPRLKICVSSRPWNVFRDAFDRNPSLRVQNLTRGDIQLFVQDRLGDCIGFQELQVVHPRETKDLVEDTVNRAEGVFLWVKLVVKALVEGLSSGDRLSELQETLKTLPKDLSQLLQAIWNRIDARYHEEAIQLFQLREASFKIDIPLHRDVLFLCDKEYSIDISYEEIMSVTRGALQRVNRRLSSRTKGLLEYSATGVDYMHRTVRDWATELLKGSPVVSNSDYDPCLMLMKAIVLKFCRASHEVLGSISIKYHWSVASYALSAAYLVKDIDANRPLFFSVLDRLDAAATELARQKFDLLYEYDVGKTGFPHWSCLQFVPGYREERWKVGGLQTTFIGLLSQVPVTAYVQSKVRADPSLLRSEKLKNYLNPAEVLPVDVGFQNCKYDNYFKDLRPVIALPRPDEGRQARLELLRFLIEQGADVSRLKAHLTGLQQWRYQLNDLNWKEAVLQTILDTEKEMEKAGRGRISRLFHRLASPKKSKR